MGPSWYLVGTNADNLNFILLSVTDEEVYYCQQFEFKDLNKILAQGFCFKFCLVSANQVSGWSHENCTFGSIWDWSLKGQFWEITIEICASNRITHERQPSPCDNFDSMIDFFADPKSSWQTSLASVRKYHKANFHDLPDWGPRPH